MNSNVIVYVESYNRIFKRSLLQYVTTIIIIIVSTYEEEVSYPCMTLVLFTIVHLFKYKLA